MACYRSLLHLACNSDHTVSQAGQGLVLLQLAPVALVSEINSRIIKTRFSENFALDWRICVLRMRHVQVVDFEL